MFYICAIKIENPKKMNIQQFYDEGLAHASYAILSGGKVALVDPGRNPQQYYDFAEANGAKIVAVIETHPHADFVSSHLEFHKNEQTLETYVHPNNQILHYYIVQIRIDNNIRQTLNHPLTYQIHFHCKHDPNLNYN
jgi:glyoxylase-like metal-dependent hydrolase (beta-lactamase superfamily II)